MADIFSRASDVFGGSFAADSAFVTFAQDFAAPGSVLGTLGAGPTSGVGMLTQSLQFAYQQQVTKVYEIGTKLSFYIAGRTNGSASIGRILGPRPLAMAFYSKYGNVCNAATNNLDIELATGCGQAGGYNQRFSLNLRYCVIVSIAVSMTAQDMMINEQLQIMFASLDVSNLGLGPVIQQLVDQEVGNAAANGSNDATDFDNLDDSINADGTIDEGSTQGTTGPLDGLTAEQIEEARLRFGNAND